MLSPKTLTLVLFGSLGLNIFFAGTLTSRLMHESAHDERMRGEHAAQEVREKKGPRKKLEAHLDDSMKNHKGARSKDRDARESLRHRGPKDQVGGADLMLMRRMVRIMGGPNDPRIKQLRDEKKGVIDKMRKDVHAAHERVRLALSSEDANQKELSKALENLRKTTFEAQARAQEGLVMLAGMMTKEERKKLRESAPQAPPRRP